MNSDFSIRPAIKEDAPGIAALLNYKHRVHRHLDWKTPLELLGTEPFWLITHQNIPVAALACQQDPPGIAWVRFFACIPRVKMDQAWQILFQKTLETFEGNPPHQIVSVSVADWFEKLLIKNHFEVCQHIVVLAWQQPGLRTREINKNLLIRTMQSEDLEEVSYVDQSSFQPLWQNSLDNLHKAFNAGAYSSVAVLDGKIVGYQISSASLYNTHLARLAVNPEYQRNGIGQALVMDLIQWSMKNGIFLVTVNTQQDNKASLSLYHKMGFQETGDVFPVFTYRGSDQ